MKMQSHYSAKNRSDNVYNDLFGDNDELKPNRTERRNEKKRQKQSFKNMVRQGRYDELDEYFDE